MRSDCIELIVFVVVYQPVYILFVSCYESK